MKEKRLFLCSSCTQDITFVHLGKIKITLKKKKREKQLKQGQFYHRGGKKRGEGIDIQQ